MVRVGARARAAARASVGVRFGARVGVRVGVRARAGVRVRVQRGGARAQHTKLPLRRTGADVACLEPAPLPVGLLSQMVLVRGRAELGVG